MSHLAIDSDGRMRSVQTDRVAVHFNPDQPREPAGSPEGGQFASGGAGGAGAGGAATKEKDPLGGASHVANVSLPRGYKLKRGPLIVDHSGRVYRVATDPVAYHEDVRERLYGVRPVKDASLPPELRATQDLRGAIDHVLRDGTHTPESRSATPASKPMPVEAGPRTATWQDGKLDSLASFPHIDVHQGGYLRAVEPIYDDAPRVAWVHDPELASKMEQAIRTAPKPYFDARV